MKKILYLTTGFLLFLLGGLFATKTVEAMPAELECDDFTLGVRYERIWQGQEVTLTLHNSNNGGEVEVWGMTDNTNYQMHLGMQGEAPSWNVNPWQGENSLFEFHYDTENRLTLNHDTLTALFSVSTGSPGTPFGFYFGQRQIKLGFNVERDGALGTETLFCESNVVDFEVIHETHIFDPNPPRSDYVYVADDELSILFEGLPTRYAATQNSLLFQIYGVNDNFMLSSGIGYNNTSGENGAYATAPEICFQRNIVEGLDANVIMGETVWCTDLPELINGQTEFTGIVREDLAPGEASFVLTVSDPTAPEVVIGPKPFISGDGGPDSNMIILGLENIAEAEEALGLTLPDLLSQNDLYNTNLPATFGKPGVGSITFAPGLNILGNLQQFAALATDFSIEYDADNNRLRASVNTEVLTFLAGVGATIQFDNAMALLGAEGITADNVLDFIDVYVYDGGELVEDLSDYLDLSGIIYDDEYDILYIPVNHFTDYEIRLMGDSEEIPATGVSETFIWLLISGIILISSTYIVRKKLRA